MGKSKKISPALAALLVLLATVCHTCNRQPATGGGDAASSVAPRSDVRTRTASPLRFTVRRLSDAEKGGAHGLDFQLTIAPEEATGSAGDVMYYGIQDRAAYKQRFHQLHFGMEDHLFLQDGDREIAPRFTRAEYNYGLDGAVRIHMHFTPPEEWQTHPPDKVRLVFADRIFSTGIHHFIFDYPQPYAMHLKGQ